MAKFGDECCGLFSPESVGKLASVVTGILPEKLFFSGGSDILLTFSDTVDVVGISSQLDHLIIWMGRTVKIHCHRPSGVELQNFGVMGIIRPNPPTHSNPGDTFGDGDQALHIPCFSISATPSEDEVDISQWMYHVRQAQQYCSPEVVRAWIYRSLRGVTLQTVINLGEGFPTSQILSRLCLKYGFVSSLMT